MDFNQANVDGRQRYRIQGRVLVFTTSTRVEYLRENLTLGIPLFAPYQPGNGQGVVFTVEFEAGFLTFDSDAYIKIIELGIFKNTYFNPLAVQIVTPADPFQPVVLSGGQYDANQAFINVLVSPTDSTRFYFPAPGFTQTQVTDYIAAHFPVGSPFKGANGYSGITLTT